MWPNDVRKKDLQIEYYRGSGKGGQHRNKRDTACRITHNPTGLSATAEDSKSQSQNKRNAFKKLAEKLTPLMVPRVDKVSSNERIRTYHEPRGEVIDHRINKKFNYHDIIEGNMSELIEEVIRNGRDD